MSKTLELTMDLIRKKSITPDDAGCQTLISQRLEKSGFKTETMNTAGVSNAWITHGQGSPCFVFAGHTDVVPPGNSWHTDPFVPTIIDGTLHGRGAADMKSGLAAMVLAAENFVTKNPDHAGTLALLLTSDEEGSAEHGTKVVIQKLQERQTKIDYCLIGEATSATTLGDAIRVGRRGSLHGYITIHGIAKHVAYPDKVQNIIHAALPALQDLSHEIWDQGNEVFPPTSFQIINVNSNSPAENSTSSELKVHINFRFSNSVTDAQLQERVQKIFDRHHLKTSMNWRTSAHPFYTPPGSLVRATQAAIQKHLKINTELSTAGGTSDGRFIAPTGAQVLECGPCNNTIHKANEGVSVADLDKLTELYEAIATSLLCPQ